MDRYRIKLNQKLNLEKDFDQMIWVIGGEKRMRESPNWRTFTWN
jgi:hypothetical protein